MLNWVGYDCIGGYHEQLAKFKELVEFPLRYTALVGSSSFWTPRGVLLHGPPGTGKELWARAVAFESRASFLLIRCSELKLKSACETHLILNNVFDEAKKNSPAVIFIDKLDMIFTGSKENDALSQLLTLTEKMNKNCVVVASTYHVNLVDQECRRFGRFDRDIHLDYPDAKEREKNLCNSHKIPEFGLGSKLSTAFRSNRGMCGC